MVWPLIFGVARTYAPYLVWPIAAGIGIIGYNLESFIRGDRQTPWKEHSIAEERDLRMVEENRDKDMTQVDSLKEKKFVPKTIFERNQ